MAKENWTCCDCLMCFPVFNVAKLHDCKVETLSGARRYVGIDSENKSLGVRVVKI